MQTAQEIYTSSISQLPTAERLRLAALILNGITLATARNNQSNSIRQMLTEIPSERLFKTSAKVDEYLEMERDSWER